MQLKPLEELFGVDGKDGTKEEKAGNKEFEVVKLDPYEVEDFPGHPFKVQIDEAMAELIESIRKRGVLMPGIARPTQSGGYQAIAGHRRKTACKLAEVHEMPFLVRDYSDDEATIIMVESNIQRPDISIKEKAFAYRMHMDAQKRISSGKQMGAAGRSDEILAQKTGESRNTIQRYIRLTYLIPDLMDMADDKKIPVITASDLSYLKEAEQRLLLTYMQENHIVPSGAQAKELKEHSRSGKITQEILEYILYKEQRHAPKVVFKREEISKYFPETYGAEEIGKVIIQLLEKWQRENMEQEDKEPDQVPGQTDIMTLEGGRYMPGS